MEVIKFLADLNLRSTELFTSETPYGGKDAERNISH